MVAQYADFYFEYDAQRRVTRETVNGGSQTYQFSYSESSSRGRLQRLEVQDRRDAAGRQPEHRVQQLRRPDDAAGVQVGQRPVVRVLEVQRRGPSRPARQSVGRQRLRRAVRGPAARGDRELRVPEGLRRPDPHVRVPRGQRLLDGGEDPAGRTGHADQAAGVRVPVRARSAAVVQQFVLVSVPRPAVLRRQRGRANRRPTS